MSDNKTCPKCNSPYAYPSGLLWVCPECNHEWNADEVQETEEIAESGFVVKDVNGNLLQDGDSVIIVKDLPVKGAPKPLKAGTKVKNIRLKEGADNHNIDCKIDGFGSMALKSIYVKKA
jgi:protein PhnA